MAVQVGKSRHRLAYDHEYFMVCYVTVVPVESVFFRAVRHHGVRALETKPIGQFGGVQ